MSHTPQSGHYEKTTRIPTKEDNLAARIRPLTTLKAYLKATVVNKFRVVVAIIHANERGEFTEKSVVFMSIDSQKAEVVQITSRKLECSLTGLSAFVFTPEQSKLYKATKALTQCRRTALEHVVMDMGEE